MPDANVLVVEDDYFTRLIQVVLDPAVPAARRRAFADFFAHDEPDFEGWCERTRSRAGDLLPVVVHLVASLPEMRLHLRSAIGLVVEALPVGPGELEAAPHLRVVQKFGVNLRNIDCAACVGRGIQVLTLRRRANISCAEHALMLMLMLARRAREVDGLITVRRLVAVGLDYRPFDRSHTANANWPRIPGLRGLNEATVGIVGLGEIGREVASRAAAFGMHVNYHQRTRLPPDDEQALQAHYVSLETLLVDSDFVVVAVSGSPETRHLLNRDRLALTKRGAFIVNIARADVVERAALIELLARKHLGGFALDPLYEEPARDDDELLRFANVILTPHTAAQPRFNALHDIENLVGGLARALAR
jgi:phosphoglycerate dehydrogenase-like enzyme